MAEVHASVGDLARYARGNGRYVADVRLSGQAAMCVVRSYLPHAQLRSVDTAEARRLPGVLGAWAAGDVISDLGTVPLIRPRLSEDPAAAPYLQGVLAHDRVRYVGEPVAIVAAETRQQAEDAAEAILVEYEPLDAIADPIAAAAAGAPPIFAAGNVISTAVSEFGDVDAVFAAAPVVVEQEISTSRHSGIPMETRGLVADPGTGDHITIWGSAKVPHANRAALAQMLGWEPERIRMIETDMGGGFGIRGEFYPEDFLTAWAALRLGRPLGWIEDRWEHMVSANQSRGQVHRAAICATEDGEVLGLRSEFWMDCGGYVRTVGTRVADLTLGELPGPYRFGCYRGVGHSVITNCTPTGTYRSPGRFESSFVRERLLDALADRLGVDSRELRRRNLVRPRDMPYRSGLMSAGKTVSYTAGDFPVLFDDVVAAASRLEAEAREAHREDADVLVGSGVGSFIEKSGLGPFEEGSVSVDADGSVTVRTGATFFGQGLNRALAAVVASELGVSPDAIKVMKVDTDYVPRGVGTYASRGMVMAGCAVQAACGNLIELARAAAAVLLEVAPEQLSYSSGAFRQPHQPGAGSVTLAQVAGSTRDKSLVGHGRFEADHVTFGFGTHAAVCSVDINTGQVQVEALVLGYDAGRVIDQVVVEGQLRGAATQAMGGTLLECFAYDSSGTPLATTFMDYLMPTAAQAPRFEIILASSEVKDNPLGVRGAGEAAVPGIAAAIARAIESACGSQAALFGTPIRSDVTWALCPRPAGG